MRDINVMNGLKSGLSFLLSAILMATFAAARIVAWPQAALMMVAATLGGYVDARASGSNAAQNERFALPPVAHTVPTGVFGNAEPLSVAG